MKVSRKIQDIRLSIRKISDMASAVPGCIRFDIGQPDFRTPKNIQDAAIKAIKDGSHGYTPIVGIPPLRQAVADYEKTKGFEVTKENIMITTGGMGAIFTTLLGFLEPGDEIIFPDPTWPPYKLMASSVGGVPKLVPYFNAGGSLDTGAIEKAITPKTKFLLVNTPENPTGRIIEKKELKAIAQIAEDKNIMIISDEVYDRILFDGNTHTSIRRYAPDNTIIINSVSKTYAMTGWRLGWLVAEKDTVDQLLKCNRASVACPNTISQYAALEALTGPQDSVKKMVAEYQERKDLIVKMMDSMGWDYILPRGALYTFPKACKDSWKYSKDLIEKAKVSVVPGLPCGPKSEGYVRFCFGSANTEQIKEGFERIQKFEG